MSEKEEFSARLRAAVTAAGYKPSGSVIESEFNRRWHGRSISNQAAWNWLNGRAIPSQDKLQVLAEWLKIEPQALRFGESVALQARDYRKRWNEQLGHLERETMDAYLRLPAPQRLLVREIVLTFAKVYAGADGDSGP